MNDTSKLLLTVVIGGTILGAGLSRHVSPLMNPSPEADWRDRYRSSYSDNPVQFVDAGPIDLSPAAAWPGAPFGPYSAMAQTPVDHGPDYGAGYRIEDYPGPQDISGDPAAEYGPEPSAAVEDAAQEAVTTVTAMQQTASRPTTGVPASRVIFSSARPPAPSGAEPAGAAAVGEAPMVL